MASEVLSTPELLEQILIQLPIRALLVAAPLVSKTWHAVTLLPSVQRALFFEPNSLASVSERVRNPLLMETFPLFFAFQEGGSWPGSLDAIETMPWSRAPDAFRREEASWRRMLVSRPPMQTMVIEQREHGVVGTFERQAMLQDLSLRVGVLYDLIVSFISNDDVLRFRIRWHDGTEMEGDVVLELFASYGCMDGLKRRLNKRFRSDGEMVTEIPFGEWEPWADGD